MEVNIKLRNGIPTKKSMEEFLLAYHEKFWHVQLCDDWADNSINIKYITWTNQHVQNEMENFISFAITHGLILGIYRPYDKSVLYTGMLQIIGFKNPPVMTQEIEVKLTLEVDAEKSKADIIELFRDLKLNYIQTTSQHSGMGFPKITLIDVKEESEIYETENSDKIKKTLPLSKEWEEEANELARSLIEIVECEECNHPVVEGYCCSKCGHGES